MKHISSGPSKKWSERNRGRVGPREVSPNLWWKIGIILSPPFLVMALYVFLTQGSEGTLAICLNIGTMLTTWLILYLLRHPLATLPDSD